MPCDGGQKIRNENNGDTKKLVSFKEVRKVKNIKIRELKFI